MGEVFVLVSNSEAQERLEEAKTSLQVQLDKLQESMAEVEEVIKTVKSQLYAKFGDNINLEPE